MKTKAYLRAATMEDAQLLFEWANDEECRKNSFHSKHIEWEEHLAWLEKQLLDAESKIYIYVDKDRMIGQIRFTPHTDGYMISYSIAKQHRCQGYGKQILMLAETKMSELGGKSSLYAQVKYSNIASQHLFEQLGYDKNELQNFIEYRKIEKV